MVRHSLLLSLVALVCSTHAYHIVESDHVLDLKKYIKDRATLVVFDLDQVVIRGPHDFSGDLMFSHVIGSALKRGLSIDDAIGEFLPIYVEIQRNIQMELCEEVVRDFIAELQRQHIPVIALTSRSVPIEERTIEILRNLGIDFSKNAPSGYTIDLSLTDPSFYKQGIIFTGQNHKGHLLIKFLDHLEIVPSRVIFINDKEKYLHEIGESMDERGIDYVGIRYGYTDNDVANFNPMLAKAQLNAFLKNYGLHKHFKEVSVEHPAQRAPRPQPVTPSA